MTRPRPDYYDVLDVPRTADDEEIRRAYLALARDLHPDVSGEPDAEDRFREVAAAYSVLSKPTARFLYDRFGYLGRGGGFGSHGGGASRVVAEVEIDPVEADRGTSREVRLAADDDCALCGGSGAVRGTEIRTCTTCGGSGRMRVSAGMGMGRLLQVERCQDCEGVGRVMERACPECRGRGRVLSRRVLKVRIPPGVEHGTRLRVLGEPEEHHLLIRILPGPIDSVLARWAATLLLLLAIGLLVYLVAWV